MPPAALLALSVLAALVVFAWTFAAVFLTCGPWARVKIDEVKLGFGPAIFMRVILGTNLSVHLLPITANATPRGMNPYEEEAVPPEPPLLLWAEAPVGRRILALLIAPRILPSVIGVLLVGPRAYLDAFLHGFADVFAAFYAPLPLLDRAAERLASEGFLAVVGLALAKLAAWHLVQLPVDVIPMFWRDRKTAAKVFAVVQLSLFSIGIAWVIGLVRWVLR